MESRRLFGHDVVEEEAKAGHCHEKEGFNSSWHEAWAIKSRPQKLPYT